MLAAKQDDDGDDVSNLHRRWSFTRITPGSLRASYAMALSCAFVLVFISDSAHLGVSWAELALRVPLGVGAVAALTFLDFAIMRGTPVNKLSKVVHVTAFSNLLWALTVIVGMLADVLFAKPGATSYIVAGMLLAAGMRVSIFTSVFGASIGRALAVCLVQPLLFFFAFVPFQYFGILADPVGLGFGALFVVLAAMWAAMVDRAGRPNITSTFKVLQAFLSAWTESKTGGIEEYLESKSSVESVSTKVLRLIPFSSATETATTMAGKDIAMVLPDVHPGPFGTIGGSNLPYVLFEKFSRRALVMHSVSDHSLNIPSGKEVKRYTDGLQHLATVDAGRTCSEPVQRKKGDATVTAIAFGRSALLMLSLAPRGMEDVPQSVKDELEAHAGRLGFASLLVVDCHNAMGKHIGDADRADLLSAATECLDDLRGKEQHEFSAGFASIDSSDPLARSSELGQAGLAVVVLSVQGRNYAIGWADSNNMENSVRDRVIAKVRNVTTMLEVCTSDTHSTSGKRTREGYFSLGSTEDPERIAGAFLQLCGSAAKDARECRFDLASATSEVKVMGVQFGDYSAALDKSMNITKVFVGVTFAAFILMQILAR
jgi:putative membrane protein